MVNNQCINAQKNIAGEYSLTGVMETASGLQLNKDSTFNFYFSYGALDRYGSGKWRLEDSNIILDSKPYPGKDFKLTKSSSEKNKFITLKIDDKNKNLFSLVYCLVKRPGGDTILNADENGIFIVKDAIDSIHLLSELCSERITSFPVTRQLYNSYTFEFEPWITEIFFKSFVLRYGGDHLEGRHPLLADREYTYRREK
jgi:hypothetical protein